MKPLFLLSLGFACFVSGNALASDAVSEKDTSKTDYSSGVFGAWLGGTSGCMVGGFVGSLVATPGLPVHMMTPRHFNQLERATKAGCKIGAAGGGVAGLVASGAIELEAPSQEELLSSDIQENTHE